MKILTAVLALVSVGAGIFPAQAEEPPQITWEWFNTAETYRRYAVKGKDDLRISARYFHLAAKNGNASAAYKLAEAYENGMGVRQDLGEALHWYRKSAEQGDRYAELRIGWFYHKGLTMPADAAVAAGWYRRSAEKNNIWAYHMLAFMLMDGEGVPKDLDLARRYFEKTLPETNDHWAKLKLSQLIKASDPARSEALLRQSAEAGNAQAAEELKRQ